MKTIGLYLFATFLLGTFTALIAFHPLSWISFALAYVFWGGMLAPMLNDV